MDVVGLQVLTAHPIKFYILAQLLHEEIPKMFTIFCVLCFVDSINMAIFNIYKEMFQKEMHQTLESFADLKRTFSV